VDLKYINSPWNEFSNYLKKKYGGKVYKLPVNLPATCPNRDGTIGKNGCIFCGGEGAGFELLSFELSVKEQLQKNMEYIGRKYKADKFIAYFQNYTNTYFTYEKFSDYISQAIIPKIVAIYVSTRPDCIYPAHMEFLKNISINHNVDVVLELGLQSIKNETLKVLNRGHTVEDFFTAVDIVKSYGLDICAHVINDLPYDDISDIRKCASSLSDAGVNQVKCHSLYILDDTVLGEMYKAGSFQVLSSDMFIKRTAEFLSYLDENIPVQRLIGRAPSERTLFCNWNMSWWKINDMIQSYMIQNNLYQGCKYNRENKRHL